MAAEFHATIERALAEKQIAGGAAIAADRSGKILFSKEFGKISLDSEAQDFKFDTTLWIASSTKLLTSIAAMQCVEKGLLNLDEDIANVLPQWKDPDILTGFDSAGKPLLIKAKEKITLRRLLTHSSGMVYSGMNQLVKRYRTEMKLSEDSGDISKDTDNPLMFEPGSGWQYSVGIDWAGQLVEKVSGMRLGDWMKQYIFEPLGMNSTTFKPIEDQSVMNRMVGRVTRSPTGELVKDESNMYTVKDRKDDWGGSGLYSSAEDYIKVLISLLGNDRKLIKGECYEELFKGQLENPQAFHAMATHPVWGAILAPGYPRTEDTQWNYGLGGAAVDKAISEHAAKGTLFWSGLPNNYWFIDRETGVCGYYASWLLPPGDAVTGNMFAALQRGAVKEIAKL